MGKPKKISPDLIQLALEVYGKLKSGNAVAKRLGVSPPTAYTMLKMGGITVPGWSDPKVNRRKITEDTEKALIADYRAITPNADLEKKYGVTSWTIRSVMRRNGIPIRKIGGMKRELTGHEVREVRRLYSSEKLSQEQIAVRFGCSQALISKTLKHLGIPTYCKTGGANHHAWLGGRARADGGYIKIMLDRNDPFHAMCGKTAYAPEHRVVMARHLGRILRATETVHHINGIASDNRIENLQLRHGRHGRGVALKCACCGSANLIEISL